MYCQVLDKGFLLVVGELQCFATNVLSHNVLGLGKILLERPEWQALFFSSVFWMPRPPCILVSVITSQLSICIFAFLSSSILDKIHLNLINLLGDVNGKLNELYYMARILPRLALARVVCQHVEELGLPAS